MLEITGFSEGDPEFPTDYWPGIWDRLKYKGKNWGMPFEGSVTFFVCNDAVFEKAQVPVPTEDWTVEDILQWSPLVVTDSKGKNPGDAGFNRNDVSVWAVQFSEYPLWLQPVWIEAGTDIVSADKAKATVDTPEMLEVLNWFCKLFVDPPAGPLNPGPGAEVGMATNNLGAQFQGSWVLPSMEQLSQEKSLKWTWLPFPKWKKGGESRASWPEKELYLAKNSKADPDVPKAAYTFEKWLWQPQQQARWCVGSGYLPLTQGAFKDPLYQAAVNAKPWVKKSIDLFAKADSGWIWPGGQECHQLMYEMMQLIPGGSLKADGLKAALSDLQVRMQEVLDKANA